MKKLLFLIIVMISGLYSVEWRCPEDFEASYAHEDHVTLIHNLVNKLIKNHLFPETTKCWYYSEFFAITPINQVGVKWEQEKTFFEDYYDREFKYKRSSYNFDYIYDVHDGLGCCFKYRAKKYNQKEEHFDFFNTESFYSFLDKFRDDYEFSIKQAIELCQKDLEKMEKSGCIGSRMAIGYGYKAAFSNHKKKLTELNQKYKLISNIDLKLKEIRATYLDLLDECSKYCEPICFGSEKVIFAKGFVLFKEGQLMDCLETIKQLIDEYGLELSKFYQLEGEVSQELGLYLEAIEALTKAITLDPENKEAYYDRAACYFEQGLFEKSLEDFIKSGFKSDRIGSQDFDSLDFAAGLIKATAFAAQQSLAEFGPSVLSSVQGVTNGLWAFVTDPLDCSSNMIDACQAIGSLLMDNNARENLKLLLPEVASLFDRWETSSSYERGELMGRIIGHYGVDFLLVAGSAKMIKSYRDLKKANDLMTLEGLANLAKREQILAQSNKWNKESGKALEQTRKDPRELYKKYRDIADENQLRKILHREGITTFKKPAGIPKEWQVKVTKKSGGMKYFDPTNHQTSIRVMPGKPNSPNVCQRKPYVLQSKKGNVLDKYGRVVSPDDPLAHIPLTEFINYVSE